MNPLLTVLFLFSPSFASGVLIQSCPTQDISPCKCSKSDLGQVTVDCSRASSGAEISSVLTNASWRYPILWQFLLEDNPGVVELPEGSPRGPVFQVIRILRTGVKRISPSAVLPSKLHLEQFMTLQSRLEEFPFQILQEFQRLKQLYLFTNLLTTIPAFESDSLETIILYSNKIASIEFDGRKTPKLRELGLGNNLLTSVPPFKSDRLEILLLNNNNLKNLKFDGWETPKLKTLSLEGNLLTASPTFKSDSLETLSLLSNRIKSVDIDRWTTPKLRELDLGNNFLTSVPAFKSDSLEKLLLNNNNLANLKLDEWETPNLKTLSLEGNLLTSVPAIKSDSLENLSLFSNMIKSVDIDKWTTPKLRELRLGNNLLASVPAFNSDSLEILKLNNNNITSFEANGWTTPNLREFNIQSNPLLKFPSAVIKNLKKLETFWCSGCNLGPTLSSGLLAFQSKTLQSVVLTSNGISRLEPGAITGLERNTLVHLNGNKISALSIDNIRPMLDVLSRGNGVLDLRDNPIRCDYEIAWVVLHRKYLKSISGKCHNETDLKDLDLYFMKNCDRECPYECIISLWLPLCTPGTVSLSHVDNCRSGELCCKPNIPESPDESTDVDVAEVTSPSVPKISFGSPTGCEQLSTLTHGSITIESCPTPSERIGENDNVECIQDGKYEFGTVVRYTCDNYYILRGSEFRRCTHEGEWTGNIPFCEPVCGRKNYQVTLSKGGKPSPIGEWPWQAAIYDVNKQDVICGGALVLEQWVLTAAHCVTVQGAENPLNRTDLLIYLGKHHRAVVKDDEYVQIRQVSRIIVHRDFSVQNYDSDIALLELAKPFVLTARVQLVCLPTQLYISEENLQEGIYGWVAGWGYDESDLPAAVLTEVQLPVASVRSCLHDIAHLTGNFTAIRTITSNMFCAGLARNTSLQDYRTVCPGDSGSPMVFLSNVSLDSHWTVEGIVSHFFQKEPCSLRRPGQYGVFTKINGFTRWINDVLEDY